VNAAALERSLRKRLCAQTRIVAEDVRGFGGYAEYRQDEPNGALKIAWDPFQYDLLGLVIHELCHPRLDGRLEMMGGQAEPAIEGIAENHAGYIRSSKARYAWWRREIKRRLDPRSLKVWRACE